MIRDQFPHWSDRAVSAVHQSGTDHAIYRVGEELAARLPLRAGEPSAVRQQLLSEAHVLEEFATSTQFPSPEYVALGEPDENYPLPWMVQTWLPGQVATPNGVATSDTIAEDLATLIVELRSVDVDGRRFSGSGRGGDLTTHDEWMETCFQHSEGLLEVSQLRASWGEFRQLPRISADVMTHGDLIPQNILVTETQISGVLDAGGFGPADPALDLVAAWHLFDDTRRERVRSLLGCDDLEWRRAAAWAFQQAMGLVWFYIKSNPGMADLGRSTLRRIQEDPELFH